MKTPSLRRRTKSGDADDRPTVETAPTHEDRLSVEDVPPKRPRRKRGIGGRRPGRRFAVIVGVLLGLVALTLVWLFYFSSVFALKQVVVQGVRGISPQHIVDTADLSSGTPLAQIDQGTIESRIRDIAAISEVHVSVRWPHTLVIDIVERAPVAYVKTPTGFAMIDVNSAQFDSQKKKPPGLPFLNITDPAAQTAALKVLVTLPPDVLGRVQSATADNPQTIVLHLSGGITVVWGGPEQASLKAQVLRALLAKTKFKWFDLRAPDAPTGANASPIPAPSPTPTPPPGASADPNATGAAPSPSPTPLPSDSSTVPAT